MKRVLRLLCVVSLGLVATACDKCGNPNLNMPQFCNDQSPRT
jgi:hypothetical protein